MECKKCNIQVIKNGKQANGKQRYFCKTCNIRFQKEYHYKACLLNVNGELILLLKFCVGVNDRSKILGISKNTVLDRLLKIANSIDRPQYCEKEQQYEMDEMRIILKSKQTESWLIYAINRTTKEVIDFRISGRSKLNIGKVVESILELSPKRIYTDRLNIYNSLLPKSLHDSRAFTTNCIERKNLTLRTHIKRLVRRTICFSKKLKFLEAHLKIYFWQHLPNYAT